MEECTIKYEYEKKKYYITNGIVLRKTFKIQSNST